MIEGRIFRQRKNRIPTRTILWNLPIIILPTTHTKLRIPNIPTKAIWKSKCEKRKPLGTNIEYAVTSNIQLQPQTYAQAANQIYCSFCDLQTHSSRDCRKKCRASNCFSCGKQGHYARVCRSTPTEQQPQQYTPPTQSQQPQVTQIPPRGRGTARGRGRGNFQNTMNYFPNPDEQPQQNEYDSYIKEKNK